MVEKFDLVVGNACTLVPTVLRWHGKTEFKCHFHFSFSHDIEKQIWILLFVFRFRLTLKNGLNFVFCFSFSHHFEKDYEFQFSFFVFASLWKTDMNFVFRFSFSHHFEKQIWISFVIFAWLEKQDSHLKPRPPPQGWPGYSWIFLSPGPKWLVNFPHLPPQWYVLHTRGTTFFNNGWQMMWW